MDRHTLNLVSLGLGFFGGIYLSYDLFGKPKGPLRFLLIFASIVAFGFIEGYLSIMLFSLQLSSYFIIVSAVVFVIVAGFTSFILTRVESPTKMRSRIYQGAYQILFALIGNVFASVLPQISEHGLASLFTGKTIFPFLALIAVYVILLAAIFVVFRVASWATTVSERSLGTFGAILTTLAFAMQFWLAATS